MRKGTCLLFHNVVDRVGASWQSAPQWWSPEFKSTFLFYSSQTESSARDSTISIHEISRKSSDDRANVSKVSANGSIRRSEAESMDESIEEDVESSRIEDANVSRQKSIETEVDESSPARKTSEIDPNTEGLFYHDDSLLQVSNARDFIICSLSGSIHTICASKIALFDLIVSASPSKLRDNEKFHFWLA